MSSNRTTLGSLNSREFIEVINEHIFNMFHVNLHVLLRHLAVILFAPSQDAFVVLNIMIKMSRDSKYYVLIPVNPSFKYLENLNQVAVSTVLRQKVAKECICFEPPK